MSLFSGISTSGGNLPEELISKINKLFKLIDKAVINKSQEKGLTTSQVRLLKPCNHATLVNGNRVFVVLTNINVGGMPKRLYYDVEDKQLNLITAIHIVERDVAFEQSFGIEFPKSYLETEESQLPEIAENIANEYIEKEILYLEQLNRIVRMNPIFNGRDFLLNQNSIFVLCPFIEPFNNIYTEHIKPTVEKIEGLQCRRADDIYDNRQIIEDIWKEINEASIIISDLTGRNPNVFYETGIAHTVGKEVILLSQYIDDVPFDLRHLRCLIYDNTPRGIELLEINLASTIQNVHQRFLSNK